jgi:hypothetical protein
MKFTALSASNEQIIGYVFTGGLSRDRPPSYFSLLLAFALTLDQFLSDYIRKFS